jgi:hypothetical protein
VSIIPSLMSIQAYTLNITYKDTTRPITFVENATSTLSFYQITALTLYTFKDLIPDYQQYSKMGTSFNIKKDTEGTLVLPNKTFRFTIQTLGHGELEIEIDNQYCRSHCYITEIEAEIQKQIGISTECIQLCDIKGQDITKNVSIKYNTNTSTLFAIFNDYKDQVLEQGYDIIDFKSVFKIGRMMRLKSDKQIGNYIIVKFSADINCVTKRTPKMITLDDYRNSKKKICIDKTGEYIVDSFSGYLVGWDESIQFGKEYAIAR